MSQALRRRSEQIAQSLREQVQQFLPLVRRVIAQTRTRVLEEKKVGLKSLQESIDTTTPGGKLIFHISGR